VVFAVQDLIKDPPFIKLDLLSCRNLLIYLDADTQERLLSVFHYALNPEGLLLLGTSETTGTFDRLFASVDRKWKIYERQPTAVRAVPLASVVAAPPKALPPLQVHRAPKVNGTKKGQGGLQLELERTRGTLRGTIAEFETSTEELKSTNEALQSMNEELQSANEELETSSEELQSLNEELQTVNAELEMKMEELSRSHDDMQNLLNGTSIATLFLDRDLKIQRFTDRVREIISVVPGDIGRPVHDLASQLRYDSLADDARSVIETLVPFEKEVRTNAGEWRLLRILPYRTSRRVIDGVVITFLDVDRVKRAELLAASLSFAQSIVQTVREPLAVLDTALNIVTANPAFKELFALSDAQLDGLSLFEAGAGFFAIPGLRRSLEEVISSGVALDDLVAEQALPGLPPRAMLLNARRLQSETAPSGHVLLALGDANGRSKG
jgi:two-component system CheB/CheR fusion protein